MFETLISLLVVLVIVALIWWAIQQLPLPPIVKTIATVILVIVICVWLAERFL